MQEPAVIESVVPRFRRLSSPSPSISPEREALLLEAMKNPLSIQRELNNRSLFNFIEYFFPIISATDFSANWHIEFLCSELEKVAHRVANRQPREYDLIINVPPGTTKTITCSIMFPAWCWTKWPHLRFITASYSAALALESADYCREIIRSAQFQAIYPDIGIKEDKDTKSNFRIVRKVGGRNKQEVLIGGSRYSTSVGGTLTGFHGDILIIDDPLNPAQAVSELELKTANHWCEQTLSTRKTDKAVTPTIYIMQRLHQDDPAGHILAKQKENIRHICLPGESLNFRHLVKPAEVLENYVDNLLDSVRLPWKVLRDLESDLGQYGYAGQIGQDPTPPGGGMFKVDHFQIMTSAPSASHIVSTVRYWDKAATADGGAYTAGVKMSRLSNGQFLVEDVKRGRWSTNEREAIIYETAKADGGRCTIWIEQEPGSGGKDSAVSTIRNLAGFVTKSERPTGDKIYRADPYSVQVNIGAVSVLIGAWNNKFMEEHRYFPFGTYKDQVDAASGAFNKLALKKYVKRIT
jgi:predicted phage terminase large subunit-like protein